MLGTSGVRLFVLLAACALEGQDLAGFSSSRFPSPLSGSGSGTRCTCSEPPAARSPVGSTSPDLRSLVSVFLTVLMWIPVSSASSSG